MAHIAIEGRDNLLAAFCPQYATDYREVKLSQADKDILQKAIVVLEHAAELWYKAEELDEDSIIDNPYAVAEIEVRCALDYK